MGGDEAPMTFQGHTLLKRLVRPVSTAASPVCIVGRENLSDKVPDCDPFGEMQTALENTKWEWNLIVAVDPPPLMPEFLKWHCRRFIITPKKLVACLMETTFPCVWEFIETSVRSLLEESMKGISYFTMFIREVDAEIISEQEIQSAGFSSSIFHNLNTSDNWQRL